MTYGPITPSVLVVDDEPNIRDAVAYSLRREGIEVSLAVDGLEGRRTDADSFAWDVPVPANGETELTFTIRQSL